MIRTAPPERKKELVVSGRIFATRSFPILCACGHLERHAIPTNYPPLQATLDMLRVAKGRCHACERGSR